MKVDVMIKTPYVAEVKPGDMVTLNLHRPVRDQKQTTVYKMVETSKGVYAVFNNGTWRPMSTYNETWRKKYS